MVVGAATGIGRSIGLAFGAEEAAVVVADLNRDRGRATAEEISAGGRKGWFVEVDVRAEDSVATAVEKAVQLLGGLDILVNVAGILRVDDVTAMTADDWSAIFDVNVRGQFFTVKHAVPALRLGGRSAIVNVASAAGFKAGAGNVAYSASKGAVIAFSRTLAMELAPQRIRVNALCPGFVDTPFNQPAYDYIGGRENAEVFVKRSIPLQRMATPAEIAPYAVFLASDESSFVTGQAVLADGGML
jgi:dihydroanticapsin dehydrogenase